MRTSLIEGWQSAACLWSLNTRFAKHGIVLKSGGGIIDGLGRKRNVMRSFEFRSSFGADPTRVPPPGELGLARVGTLAGSRFYRAGHDAGTTTLQVLYLHTMHALDVNYNNYDAD